MRTRSILALVALAGCGSDEAFELRDGGGEPLIERAATAYLHHRDEAFVALAVVDLDGDGIDDALVRSVFWGDDAGSTVYVLYGGGSETGELDAATLPALTGLHANALDVSAAGDVDGDGIDDVLIGQTRTPGCKAGDPDALGGAYLVYGSSTRLTGSTPVADAAVFFRDQQPCTASVASGVGDLDHDGLGDFAVMWTGLPPVELAQVYLFYGGARRSGTVDLQAAADATIAMPTPMFLPGFPDAMGVGDVTGDSYDDLMIQAPAASYSTPITHLIAGSPARLHGALGLDPIATTRFTSTGWWCFVGDHAATRLGDLDGDGVGDFALLDCPDAYGPGQRQMYRLFYGRAGGFPATVPFATAEATLAMTYDHECGIASGDLDGDGQLELVTADRGYAANNGGAQVIRTGGVRLSGELEPGERATTYVGRAKSVPAEYCDQTCMQPEGVGIALKVGDLTGDGRADITVLSAGVGHGLAIPDRSRLYIVPLGTNP